MRIMILGIAAAVLAAPAGAASLVYTVDQSIGFGGVTGTITTDGKFGALAAADITGFDLTVTGLGASVVLTAADSIVFETGSNLTASAAALTFDYGGPDGFVVFQRGSFGTGAKYWCNASTDGACYQGASAVPQTYLDPSAQYQRRTGVVTIATAAVPEPTTWALTVAGFALVGATARRRRTLATVRCA